MAVRYVDSPGIFLLPAPTEADPANVSGAIQLLLGAWLDVDLSSATPAGWVSATDRHARQGFVRLSSLRKRPLLKIFYIDVGQGDATVIESQDGILIVDGGPSRGLRDWVPGGIKLGHINARTNGVHLVMTQRKEIATNRKTWHTFSIPYPGPFGRH